MIGAIFILMFGLAFIFIPVGIGWTYVLESLGYRNPHSIVFIAPPFFAYCFYLFKVVQRAEKEKNNEPN